MKYIKRVDVDDALIDELWNKVKDTGSFYSIGDGRNKQSFRRVLFGSYAVLSIPGGYMRCDNYKDVVELHPILFSADVFRHAQEGFSELKELFKGRDLCCIIPSEMHGAISLAKRVGMDRFGTCSRKLSGIDINCDVYVWRCENEQQR